MVIREIYARNILSKSRIFDYAINPYTGCQHGCTYCYAQFMKRFTRHKEPWGEFVDVKINAPDLLQQEITKKPPGRVWISGVCDPYQPLEARYELTKKCLEILVQHDWPTTIQTKSALVLRDMELLKGTKKIEVGLTVTTGDERIRKLFEPNVPFTVLLWFISWVILNIGIYLVLTQYIYSAEKYNKRYDSNNKRDN